MTNSIRIIGPDADGLLWIHADAGRLQGAVSVRAASIAGRAFLAVQGEARDPEPAPPDPLIAAADAIKETSFAERFLVAQWLRDRAAPAPAASLTRTCEQCGRAPAVYRPLDRNEATLCGSCAAAASPVATPKGDDRE